MTNALAVCLVSVLFLWCTNLSLARQTPKECAKGPQYWCQNIRIGSDCGAVGHCIATVWETQNDQPEANEVSNRVIHLFRELKDVRELINEEYLAARVRSMCGELPSPASKYCKENTAGLQTYISHVLNSKTSAETMCKLIGVCSNEKVDASLHKKTEKEPIHKDIQLVGSNQCTWGPSYWCSNFSTVHQCKATKHCIQRVWSKMQLPEDNDSVCKICTDMVTQARDQLQSNETQEELKEVFEGSCNLIPIKFVAKQCIKLADDFVPELVETLASEMNPQQVCSVAGLCNNAAIDNALENYNTQLQIRTGCNNCQKTVTVLRKKFDATSYDAFLMAALRACGQVGSLSDSCSMLVFKYYENILEALKKDLTPNSLCHLSSQCSYRFHHHDDYTFPEVKLEDIQATDDVPCEFCEQLVQHLRDVLVANTTELEFQKVLKGLCKQTGKFTDECLHLVEQYYQVIYSFLTNDLQGKEICSMIGMCNATDARSVVLAPLLPRELAIKVLPLGMIGDDNPKTSSAATVSPSPASSLPPLPLERMLVRMPESKTGCSFCQYFLHYLQVELSDVNTEDKINEAVSKACDRLPQSVNDECKQFVTQYGPMVISLLVQEIDPASVCPAIGLCPKQQEVRLVSINSGKSNCPLCLFAVEQLESMLKNNHTEANIRNALDGLCNKLSQKLRTECVDFVDTYTNQLVEMLVADLNAQEICVYLKLCKDTETNPAKEPAKGIDKFFEKPSLRADRNNMRGKSVLPKHMQDNAGDIETNEIPDYTANGRPIKMVVKQKTVCVVCEFVLKEIDDQITDKHNDDEIKRVVHGICKHIPKSVKPDCDQFVEKYADLIISLLAQELNADEVCQELKLCDPNGLHKAREEILDCAVCETVVMAVRKVLANDKVDRNIVHIVEKSCSMLPAKYSTRCHTLMEIYGESVIHIIETMGTKGVCQKIGLCAARSVLTMRP